MFSPLLRAARSALAPLLVTGAVLVAGCSSTTSGSPPVDRTPCAIDSYEANETAPARKNLGTLQDDAVAGETRQFPTELDLPLSLHTASDVDWYDVDVLDRGANGNPSIRVMTGAGTEATAFWDCSTGTTKAVACGLGTAVSNDPDLVGRGCLTPPASSADVPPQLTMEIECDGTSTDNGTLHIRVRRTTGTDACLKYRLIVTAE
jgi:hypothetical protein